MSYWKTTTEMGLTQPQIEEIVEKLWEQRKSLRNCPDCGVNPQQEHLDGCDVAHCTECGIQRIQCDEHNIPDIWSGIWPGVKECYEQKLIAYGSGGEGWIFDLNTYYLNKLQIK